MEERVKKIFLKNQKSYMVISVIFYIFNLFHYSVCFDFYDINILSVKVNRYLDPLIVLILLVTWFFSFSTTSVYSFPFNILLGKKRYYGSFLKVGSFILLGVAINKVALFRQDIYIWILIILFVLIAVADCIFTNRCFEKVQSQNIFGDIIMTDISEEEYSTYITYWTETLKTWLVSACVAGLITAKNLNLDNRIVVPILGLITIYNWAKFHIRYKNVIVNKKICIISLLWLVGVAMFSVLDVYVFYSNTFSGLEYFALYGVSVIILYTTINKINFEIAKYRYKYNIGNNLFKAEQMKNTGSGDKR